MAATTAWPSAPGTASRRPDARSKLRARADLAAPRLAELAALDDAGFRALFAGSPVKRIGRDRFVRNVLIAIGNSGDPALLAHAAAALADDADPVVAEAACWAAARAWLHADQAQLLTAGHRTSVALEPAFWAVLEQEAMRRGVALASLVAAVDAERAPPQSLASALRLRALVASQTNTQDC